MSTETELLKALNQLVNTDDPTIEYRLHYNEQGDIYMCSMQQHPDSGSYVVVTEEQYSLYFRYKVVKGKLTLIEHDSGLRVNLVKSDKGFKTVKGHANLLLNADEVYNDTEYYDYRNN